MKFKTKSHRILSNVFILIILAFLIYVTKMLMLNNQVNLTNVTYLLLEIIPIALATTGISLVLYSYLEGKIKFGTNTLTEKDTTVDKLSIKIRDFEKQLNLIYTKKLNQGFSEEKTRNTIQEMINSLSSESIVTKIETEYGNEIVKQNNYNRITEELQGLERNISMYIARLNRGSSINLVIGGSTTIMAVIILGFFVFESDINYSKTTEVFAHYIPRISIAIFIEVFSFFFLKLYKTNLNDIKYFENERTNLNSKRLALKFAYLTDNKGAISITLKELSKTERNFKLSKDETTVNLEKLKLEKADETNLLNHLLNILKLKDK